MSSRVNAPKARASYTVAFICALELEMSAVRCMLDTSHPDLPPIPDDSNLYIFGELSGYDVVLAWLSGYQGKGAAAIAATNLSRSFPAIQWRFLVGIGGGVPSNEHDIRLGDVVISMPEGRYGGVVQYDLGRDGEEGFQLKGQLVAPPPQLRSAMMRMRSNQSITGNKIEEVVSEMLQRFPRLSRYRRPPSEEDVLFAVDSLHHGRNYTCGGCDKEKVISREAREWEGPEVHYGLIASGDRVMKSAAKRQATAQSLGDVLCFEMEAAGITTEYPCVTIRGISDYADSHKNDRWQCYAAAAAAAAAKELLSCIPVRVYGQAQENDTGTKPFPPQKGLNTGLDQVALPQSKKCAKSLAFAQMNDRTNDLSIKAAEGTCMWLLRHEVCANWSTKDRALLWIKGKPGSGKSTLLRWFLDERRRQNSETGNKSLILSFFFHGRGLDLEKTPLGLFRSLLHQMLSQVPEAAPDLIQIFQQRCDTMGKPGEEWHWHLRELQEALHSAISNVLERRNVWLFVDALDECGKPDAIELVRHFEHLLASTPPRNFQFSICVTCRHYPALDLGSAYEIALESENDGDISAYVRDRLSFLDATSASRIIDVISKRADGIFMWASLQIHRVLELELEGASLAKIEAEIRSTPRGLYSIYHGLVQNMIERSKSLKLLQWICFATRPLTLEELSWVLVVDADHTSPIKSLEQARNSDDYIANSVKMELQLKSLSCGLVEVVGSSGSQVAQFIHQSVRDYFVETGISALDNSLDASENNSNCVIGMAHRQISRTCIRYITMNEIVQSTARREALNARFPLLQYAVRFWTEHAKKSEQNGVTQEDLLLYFDWPSPKLLQAWRRVLDQTYNPFSGSPPAWTSMLHMLSENHLITPLRTILSPANQKNIDINERDSHGQTALFSAVSSGNVAVVKLLLGSDGIDINARDSYGQTALLGAVSRRYVAVVELPLDTDGTNMNAGDSQSQTTLLGAALYRHVAVVTLLLGADDIDINARDSHGQTALLGAALNGHAAVVQLLLGADGIDINARNSHGQTALLGAALNGHVAIVELLLDMKDVKINARNQQNLTPLLIAARHNYQSIVELLLATNLAHTNANDDFGRTPLSYAAETGHVAAIKIYVTNEENIHLRDAKGRAPLWYAARAGELQAAEILIQKGADIAAASTSGAAGLLCVAASHGQTGIIKLLLENQAEVGAATDDGTTPLHAASSHGQPQAIRLLIENQAEVGAKDIYGQTSLHLAVVACHFVSTKILLEAGADIHVANKAGETPRQLALRGGDLATLLNAGPWIWPRQDRLLHLRKLRKLVFAISFEFQL